MLVGELHVGFQRVGADTEDHGAGLLDGRILVTESAGFFGAARGVVARVEINHHRLPEEVFGSDLRTVGHHCAERRDRVTGTKTQCDRFAHVGQSMQEAASRNGREQ
jgi:hypothetical protein